MWKQVSSAREFTVTTNPEGLRTLAVTDGYDPEATRVLCVGDSVVFGWGLDDPDTYPAKLDRVLRSASAEKKTQVFNAGHPGYSSVQSYLWLQHLLPRVRPQLLVIELPGHHYRSAEKPDRLYVESDSDVTSVNYWLLEHSTLYRSIRRGILATRVASEEDAYRVGRIPTGGSAEGESSGVVRVPPEDLESVLSSLAEQGRREGFHVAVYFNLQSTARPPAYLSVVEALAQKGDITYLNELEPNLTAANGHSETYWFEDDRGHYNKLGAMLVANLVAQSLIEHGLLGPGAAPGG